MPPIDQLASGSDDLAAPRLRLTTKSAATSQGTVQARRRPRPASATALPRMGGLLAPFADSLLGQRLAQPVMLVIDVLFASSDPSK